MIEVAHDLEADGYITLLSDIQVHRVRWGDRLERLENGHNLIARELENEMVEAAELYGRAVNLLGVARPNPSAFDKTPSSRLSSLGVLSDQRQPIASVAELARSRDATDPLTVP